MTLASMIALDKDALMCDLAETYGIYDMRSLPASMVATFSVGLRDDSRIKTKIRGENIPLEIQLLGMIYDNISTVLVALGAIDKPVSVMEIMMGETIKEEESNFTSFEDAESFVEARKRIVEEITDGRRN